MCSQNLHDGNLWAMNVHRSLSCKVCSESSRSYAVMTIPHDRLNLFWWCKGPDGDFHCLPHVCNRKEKPTWETSTCEVSFKENDFLRVCKHTIPTDHAAPFKRQVCVSAQCLLTSFLYSWNFDFVVAAFSGLRLEERTIPGNRRDTCLCFDVYDVSTSGSVRAASSAVRPKKGIEESWGLRGYQK